MKNIARIFEGVHNHESKVREELSQKRLKMASHRIPYLQSFSRQKSSFQPPKLRPASNCCRITHLRQSSRVARSRRKPPIAESISPFASSAKAFSAGETFHKAPRK